MKVLVGCSEQAPYSKTGGLADVTSALGHYLGAAGVRTGVVTPLYRNLGPEQGLVLSEDRILSVPLGGEQAGCRVVECAPSENLTVYYIEHHDFFRRTGLYGEGSIDYPDNARRFLFLSRVVVELARTLEWRPDILHLHDWQVAMVPAMIRAANRAGRHPHPPRTLLTIHNLAYQGVFPPDAWHLTGLPPDYFSPEGAEYYGKVNFLKAGLVHADHLNTVSPSYAREILTGEFGCGLEGLLARRRESLSGILNGVDYREWNTTDNPYLAHPYSREDLKGKAREKRRLQADLSLPVDDRIPLFGNISRMVEQKGVALLHRALEQALGHPMQFVQLGSGDRELEALMKGLERRFGDRMRVRIGYSPEWAHRIEAASDFYLMPSRFEPCGLNQLYSLRYGTIPVVHDAGGLRDSVIDESEAAGKATGIKFSPFNSAALLEAIHRALDLYRNAGKLDSRRRRAMAQDFSWERTAQEYRELYRRMLEA